MGVIKELSAEFWIFAAMLITLVVVQAILFIRLALKFNTKHQLVTKEEINQSVRVGVISAIGPTLSTATVCITLVAMVGAAIAFMRCGVIGSADYELYYAGFSSNFLGIDLTSPDLSAAALVFCVFSMAFASCAYFINCFVSLKPLDMAVEKSKAKSKTGKTYMDYLGPGVIVGILWYLILGYCEVRGECVGTVVGFLVAVAIKLVTDRFVKLKWLSNLSLAIAMLVGMAAGQVVSML